MSLSAASFAAWLARSPETLLVLRWRHNNAPPITELDPGGLVRHPAPRGEAPHAQLPVACVGLAGRPFRWPTTLMCCCVVFLGTFNVSNVDSALLPLALQAPPPGSQQPRRPERLRGHPADPLSGPAPFPYCAHGGMDYVIEDSDQYGDRAPLRGAQSQKPRCTAGPPSRAPGPGRPGRKPARDASYSICTRRLHGVHA